MAKDLRTRFPEYLLAFACSPDEQTIDQDKVRAVLDLDAPLTDLSCLGKMRDAYPMALMGLEHIVELIEQDGSAEAVVLLPMTLCRAAIRLETISKETKSSLLRISCLLI
jgi:hypothetical protein